MGTGPRSRDYDVTLHGRYTYGTRPKGTFGDWTLLVDGQQTDRWARLIVNNPWRQDRPDGPSPTPRALEHIRLDSASGTVRWTGGVEHKKQGIFSFPASALINVGFDSARSSLVNTALLSALTKLKDQKFNSGVAIAEAEGVARMVVDAARATVAIRDSLRHGNFREAYNRFRQHDPNYIKYPQWRKKYWDQVRHVESVRRARLIPEGWLYYHYGLKPTVNDIDGAAQELILHERTNPNFWNGKVMGYAKARSKPTDTVESDWITYDLEVDVIESVRVILHVTKKDGIGAKLSTLGVTNPGEALWNRGPFTFLLDYFVGVGEWLHVMDAWVGYDFGNWEESYRLIRNGTAKANAEKSQDGTLDYMVMKPAVLKRKNLERVIHSTLYGPMASVHPRLKIPSINQLASILSLLATSFSRTVRP